MSPWNVTIFSTFTRKMDKNEELQTYLKDYWEHVLKHNPTFATYIGDHRYDDALEDLSEESISSQISYFKKLQKKSEAIDPDDLTAENRLNNDLFKNTLDNHIRMYEFKTHYIPLNQMSGPHLDIPQIIEFHPFHTRKDIDNYVARLNTFPGLVEQVIELLQKGVDHDFTEFGKVIELCLGQVEMFAACEPENHPLFSSVLKLGNGFSENDKEDIKNSVKNSIITNVTPAYKRLFHYLREKYLKYCRVHEGIWALPDGIDLYRFFVAYHTTTDLSPEEIHEIGKREVTRIGNEMKKVMQIIGFNGRVREFTDYIKGKQELYPKSREEILDGYRTILSRMDEKLPDYFGRLPRARYDIKEIEKYREQSAPAAYYYPPPEDFSRPGLFYANTYRPEQRPRFFMEALSYHEAVPGHHLQIAIMQEQTDLPDFRRHEGSTAMIEGWALYAEKLAQEMGFYQDHFSEYGRLNFEIWRAVRLVVDTGIHYYKWSRDDAIKYCLENSGEEEHEIEVEVDRYIAMPGQALAYKIGELKILELRDMARDYFESSFNIKDFHDRLLENGALPLFELETVMKNWMQ
jgi:uncharacterized protein (DUF885 family)